MTASAPAAPGVPPALILFAHGARDPRWREPFERLRQMVAAQLPAAEVRLAFLELMTPALPDAVRELARAGCDAITVVPVFLGQGGHVRRDLPALIERLRQEHPGLALRAAAAAGEDEAVLGALARYCLMAYEQS